ncbi:MAG TPA: hypothetical protein VGL06_25855 [Pseudonocardiaceae bacterium]
MDETDWEQRLVLRWAASLDDAHREQGALSGRRSSTVSLFAHARPSKDLHRWRDHLGKSSSGDTP